MALPRPTLLLITANNQPLAVVLTVITVMMSGIMGGWGGGAASWCTRVCGVWMDVCL